MNDANIKYLISTNEMRKDLTGFTIEEYAYFMETDRRIIIDNVLKQIENGNISAPLGNEILFTGNWWFREFPHLLPPTYTLEAGPD